MANVFNSVKGLHPKRNVFSAHTYRNDLTSQLGVNIPIYQQHVAPGTRIKCSTSALVRLQALIAPIMDNIDFYVHFWKIPYRLLENDRFTQFISGEISPEEYEGIFITPSELGKEIGTAIDYEEVQDRIDTYNAIVGNGSIFDYLGYDVSQFPTISYNVGDDEWVYTGGNNKIKINLRPLIAYYMLHQNWYMNENVPYFAEFIDYYDYMIKNQNLEYLIYLLVYSYNTFGTTLLPHGWEKDYFTSALPNVQYGDPVTLPIAGSASVSIPQQNFALTSGSLNIPLTVMLPEAASFDAEQNMSIQEMDGSQVGFLTDGNGYQNIINIGGKNTALSGTADLSEATAITVNEFRFANALQVFKERQMRYGRRRQEYYKGFFDVTPEDFRLQIPQYLGGGRIPINIADIEQTSKTDGSSALGHLAGKATAVAGGFAGFNTFCSEECIIIGIGFAMPHITYAQQMSRFLFKTNDIYDYFNPSFEHLGEQAILNMELVCKSNPDKEFGYTPRYNEYRFHSNEMHGEFKNSLAYWTLGRIFSSQPALNANFIYMQPSVFDRIFAVSGQPSMLVSLLYRVRLIQPVSKYGTPMLLV